jgi:hypothetical protein
MGLGLTGNTQGMCMHACDCGANDGVDMPSWQMHRNRSRTELWTRLADLDGKRIPKLQTYTLTRNTPGCVFHTVRVLIHHGLELGIRKYMWFWSDLRRSRCMCLLVIPVWCWVVAFRAFVTLCKTCRCRESREQGIRVIETRQ